MRPCPDSPAFSPCLFRYPSGRCRSGRAVPASRRGGAQPEGVAVVAQGAKAKPSGRPSPLGERPLPEEDTALPERDTPLLERETLLPERDRLLSERDTPLSERDMLRLAAGTAAGLDSAPALRGVRVAVLNFREPCQSAAGGAEEYAWQVSCHLAGQGARVRFLTAREPGQPRREVRDGIELRRMGNRYLVYLLV